MRKIVINKCFGEFDLSTEAKVALYELGLWAIKKNDRCNLDLISVIEKLGSQANGVHSELKIVEIPDDVEYTIEKYDGAEWVAEVHTASSRQGKIRRTRS